MGVPPPAFLGGLPHRRRHLGGLLRRRHALGRRLQMGSALPGAGGAAIGVRLLGDDYRLPPALCSAAAAGSRAGAVPVACRGRLGRGAAPDRAGPARRRAGAAGRRRDETWPCHEETRRHGRRDRQTELDRVLELVAAAHRGTKEAITELRDLARGIHPPALDHGLGAALATLAARSDLPVELVIDLPERPSPAIETIAYFCAAELLANAAKHSGAQH